MTRREEFIEAFGSFAAEGHELAARARRLGLFEAANGIDGQTAVIGRLISKAELSTDVEWDATHRPRRWWERMLRRSGGGTR